MKKRILGLALAAMSLVTVNSIAQTNNSNACANSQTSCPANKENATCNKQTPNGICNQKQVCPFDGLNLTDTQKDKLKQLNTKRQAARAEKQKATKAEKQQRKAAKATERRDAKKAYLEEVKVILSPEQYTMFLENFYVNAGNHPGKDFKHGKDMKKFKGDRKGKEGKRNHAHRGTKSMNNASAPTANI